MKILGIIIIALPFFALYLYAGSKDGYLYTAQVMACVFGGAGIILAWLHLIIR